MTRLLPFLVGLVLLLSAGIVHGLWFGRWQSAQELDDAAARLKELPDEVGGWRGEMSEQDPEELKLAGAVGHWSRLFTDPESGEKVLVILMCGKPARMSVHRPEHCYRSAGYEMIAPALRVQIKDKNDRSADLWTGNFGRDETEGPSRMRIFWSWYAPGSPGAHWDAPDSPRVAFAGQRVLYKMYVIRNLTAATPVENDPCAKLIGQLLPILRTVLSPSSQS
jgi:hypothetical protein